MNAKEAVKRALGDAYDCNREWSAWSWGTMSEDNFSLIADDEVRVSEIAEAALEAFGTSSLSILDELDRLHALAVQMDAFLSRPIRVDGACVELDFATDDEAKECLHALREAVNEALAEIPPSLRNQPIITKDILRDTALAEFKRRGFEYSTKRAIACQDFFCENKNCPEGFREALVAAGEKVSALYSDTLRATNEMNFDWSLDFMMIGTREGIKEQRSELFDELFTDECCSENSNEDGLLPDPENRVWMARREAFANSIIEQHTIELSGKGEEHLAFNMMVIGYTAIESPEDFCMKPY